MFDMSRISWVELRQQPLNEGVWLALLQTYAMHDQPWQLAYVVQQLSRIKGLTQENVLALLAPSRPWALEDFEAVLSRATMEDAPAHARRLRFWLQSQDGDWLAWVFLARVLDYLADTSEATRHEALTRAQSLEPIAGESAHLLGKWRLKSGNATAAVAALSQLVDLRPLRHGSMVHLGEALLRVGNVRAAEVAFSRASHSPNPAVLAWLAEVIYRNNYWQEAISVLSKATVLQPDNVQLWLSLAQMQATSYLLSACRESLAQVRRLGHNSQQVSLLELYLLGRAGDAENYFKSLQSTLLSGEQSNSRQISSVLMTALYQDELSAQELAQMHRTLMADVERELGPRKKHRLPKRRKGLKKLRVGYVSGDLHRQHPVNIFMLPLLEQQKASSLEVYIYHTGKMFDRYTSLAQACADVWVEAADWDDEALHQQILKDGVDVLVDLAGHSASHRLGVFVKRSAPVQATFLGYPHSTGLSCMDYLIGDGVVSPPEHANLFSEKIARLPGPVFCWAPVDDYPLPELTRRSGPVVFASFNNALKLSARTIALWAKVLLSVPESVLLLKAPSLGSAEVCERFQSLFAQHSIDASRLVFRGPSELGQMMQEYGDVDIALDPLPYNGGTTSLQALWMGVPVISLLGQSFQNRMGASFLHALGKSQWLAQNEGEYVKIAQNLAASVDDIRMGRAALREAMKSSALCDIKQYAADFKCLLETMAA